MHIFFIDMRIKYRRNIIPLKRKITFFPLTILVILLKIEKDKSQDYYIISDIISLHYVRKYLHNRIKCLDLH